MNYENVSLFQQGFALGIKKSKRGKSKQVVPKECVNKQPLRQTKRERTHLLSGDLGHPVQHSPAPSAAPSPCLSLGAKLGPIKSHMLGLTARSRIFSQCWLHMGMSCFQYPIWAEGKPQGNPKPSWGSHVEAAPTCWVQLGCHKSWVL